MVEIKGLVSDGIAIMQAAGKVGSLVLLLSQLWKEVKDVPETITTLVEQLEYAALSIDTIETELQAVIGGGCPPTPMCAQTIQHCRHVHKELNKLVQDLMTDIISSRRRKRYVAKMEAVLFKKAELEMYEKRFYRAWKILDMALQLLKISQMNLQPAPIASRVAESIALKNNQETDFQLEKQYTRNEKLVDKWAFPVARKPTRIRHREQNGRRTKIVKGRLIFESSILEVSGTSGGGYRIKLAFPGWLLNRAWDLQVLFATCGWNVAFRQYKMIDEGQGLFHQVMCDNHAITSTELQSSFASGRATPFIVDTKGQTLLHYAMRFRPSLVGTLLDAGLDPFGVSFHGQPPLCCLDMLAYMDLNSEEKLAFHKTLISFGAYDEYSPHAHLAMVLIASDIAVVEPIFSEIFCDYYNWPWKERLQLFWEFSFAVRDHDVGQRFLCRHGTLRAEDILAEVLTEMGSVLHNVAWMYFQSVMWIEHRCRRRCYVYKQKDTDVLRRWEMVRCVFRKVASITILPDFDARHPVNGLTPLLWGIALCRCPTFSPMMEYQRCWKAAVQSSLRAWLQDLETEGIDLEEYGKATKAVFVETDILKSRTWPVDPMCKPEQAEFGYVWKDIIYGPIPESWSLVFEWDIAWEEFLEDFWDWIDNPPMSIPGSWVD
ncbi:hypothetical protein QBC36DRAFT_211011 [Triangularia setosa]|uniref:Uncharacterized protein n=1 Tax=Triangularia setosa TaxID=2587417 RepID=A0AAN7A894_9PEZI|nr:hypothetical protein QBC36DRAFT_211011 [Podospora setosa]